MLREIYSHRMNPLSFTVSDLHTSPNNIWVINTNNEIGGACGRYGDGERCTEVLVEKPEVKGTLGRHRRSWEDNIKMPLQEIGHGEGRGLD